MALLTPTFYSNSSAVSGTTLASKVVVPAEKGDLIIVCATNNAAAGDTSGCAWGAKDMGDPRPGLSENNVGGRRLNTYFLRPSNTDERTVTVTWPISNQNRAIIIVVFKDTVRLDIRASAIQDASTAPTTGATASIVMRNNELAIAFMVSDGSTSDALGTPSGGFTLGIRDGTTALDFRAYYDDLTGMSPLATVTCSLSSTASRDWTSVMAVLFKPITDKAQIIMYAQQYEKLADSTDASKQNAVLVFMQAYFTDTLPVTPSDEWLEDINITLTDYNNAVTLLINLEILKAKDGDAMRFEAII